MPSRITSAPQHASRAQTPSPARRFRQVSENRCPVIGLPTLLTQLQPRQRTNSFNCFVVCF